MPKSRDGLTLQQATFAKHYALCGNGAAAAKLAKYSEKTAVVQASKLLIIPKIIAAVERERARLDQKMERNLEAETGLTVERVKREWERLSMWNVMDLIEMGPDGKPVIGADGLPRIDWTKLTRDQAAAICEIDPKSGKIKFVGKESVLRDVARHLQMFPKESVQVDVKVTLEQLIVQSMGVKVDG